MIWKKTKEHYNGDHFANKPLLPHSRENIILNFKFKNEATRDDLKENKTFWNKVYCCPGKFLN